MKRLFRAGAGALGGVAAGLVVLCASSAPAAEPAANRANPDIPSRVTLSADTLHVIEGEGTLTQISATAQLQPIEGVEVVRLSELSASAAFNPGGGDALTCLAQAIYFEARSQSEAGQQAVAQVVMNRTHLPQYPATVCGVVYQGSERATGCQFTFVCDGSLRPPSDLDAWGRATDIARKALAGFVYKPMQDATHYHAAWMKPYWAGSLTRIRQLGGQVFYH
jgi:hypothetical protein